MHFLRAAQVFIVVFAVIGGPRAIFVKTETVPSGDAGSSNPETSVSSEVNGSATQASNVTSTVTSSVTEALTTIQQKVSVSESETLPGTYLKARQSTFW